MTNQVQCPNCGGYKVYTRTKTIDSKSGAEVMGCGQFLLLVALCAGVLLSMIVSFEAIGIGGAIFLGLGEVILIILFILGLSLYFKADKIEKYYHECLLCGYEWSRREDEPTPPVNVRPDLIAKGEQELERRREEERRRQAAGWYYQQQRKK